MKPSECKVGKWYTYSRESKLCCIASSDKGAWFLRSGLADDVCSIVLALFDDVNAPATLQETSETSFDTMLVMCEYFEVWKRVGRDKTYPECAVEAYAEVDDAGNPKIKVV